MRKYDSRLIIGGLLILGGLLSLLDTTGIIGNASGIFWGLIWGAIGVFFLNLMLSDRQGNWWAAFPGFTLLGMAVSSFLPKALDDFSGLAFFAGLSLAFWWVFFNDISRWWAVIPGGILVTLGVISALDEISGFDTGGLFFIGIGLTFTLVAILPGGKERSWAFIPAVVLLLFGTVLMPGLGVSSYVGPAVLIVLGLYFVYRFFKPEA